MSAGDWDDCDQIVREVDRKDALRRALLEAPEEGEPFAPGLPSGVQPPARPALVVTDRFDPTMIEMGVEGAVLKIRQIPRFDALELVQQFDPPIVATNERALTNLEKQLGVPPALRPTVGPSRMLLVLSFPTWNDPRWHLIEYLSDGDGCVP